MVSANSPAYPKYRTIYERLDQLPIAPIFQDTILSYYDGDKRFVSQSKWADIMGCIPGAFTGRRGNLYGKGAWWVQCCGTRAEYAKLSSLTCKGWIDVALNLAGARESE